MSNQTRLANESWEAMYRAQVALFRSLAAADLWNEVTTTEYDVLYELSKAPAGLSMVDINRNILMTQGGVSRLVSRLERRGLLERRPDASDLRTTLITLTAEGSRIQKTVGRSLAAAVTSAMTSALDPDQMRQLLDLSQQIIAVIDPRQASSSHLPTTTTSRTA